MHAHDAFVGIDEHDVPTPSPREQTTNIRDDRHASRAGDAHAEVACVRRVTDGDRCNALGNRRLRHDRGEAVGHQEHAAVGGDALTDNARAEGFFGTLKCDFFEGRDWTGVPFDEFSRLLGEYIEWYRDGKLKKDLGWKTIREYREERGHAA